MTFEVDVNGRRRLVTVEPAGSDGAARGRFRVRLADPDADASTQPVTREVDVRQTDLGLSLAFGDDGRMLDAAVTARAAGEYLVQLPHVSVMAAVDARRHRPAGERSTAGTGEVGIRAPMPGRVLRVLVATGDAVAARQPLLVIEAMKMENELCAPRAGTVKEVLVQAGASVEAGRGLVVIE